MTKINFTKTILRVAGAISLLLSSMSFYIGIKHGVAFGIAGFILGAILLILSVVIGMEKDSVIS